METREQRVLAYARELIRRESVTPEDAGCQLWLAERLASLGFAIEHLRFGEVDNLWARRGSQRPLLAFAGHTDVVPPGDPEAWSSPPFAPEIRDGMLYGRGAADMKGSLAAMLVALEDFIAEHPEHPGSLALLITSDEEGAATDGTARVVEVLQQRDEVPDWCLVGEPSSTDHVGDVVKNGRRGSLNGELVVRGIQGHVAYPQLARNPIHELAPALAELSAVEWDRGNDYFPPTSFQVSNIRAGSGAGNVIPGDCRVAFNFRFSTEVTAELLQERTVAILDRHLRDYQLDWHLSGNPFLTREGGLVDAVRAAVQHQTGSPPALSTAGGTSDGRFIAPAGAQVVELGPVNATIHKVNECTPTGELGTLSTIYRGVLEELLR